MNVKVEGVEGKSLPSSVKSLDEKLDRIRHGRYTSRDFIIADAKDADMSLGLMAPGPSRVAEGRMRTRADYLEAMGTNVSDGLVDIMLMSASSAETLVNEGIFSDSTLTPAIRLNDATDIWRARGSRYLTSAPRPFATPSLERVRLLCDLGLYSVTFSNDRDRDLETLEAYTAFRTEARATGVRHILEIFNPLGDVGVAEIGPFVNDSIVRALAGVTSPDRPLFLKMAYSGPAALEELAAYDPVGLVVGVLGGAKGTTRDTFELVAQAERHGARVALFGRKINLAEHPTTLVRLMRQVVENSLSPAEAVRMYHAALEASGIRADRPLAEDLEITEAPLRTGAS